MDLSSPNCLILLWLHFGLYSIQCQWVSQFNCVLCEMQDAESHSLCWDGSWVPFVCPQRITVVCSPKNGFLSILHIWGETTCSLAQDDK